MPAAGTVDVFDSGDRSSRRARRLVAVVAALGVAVAGGLLLRQRTGEPVLLTASLDVTTTASSPPGGAVRWSVAVRNDGGGPVQVDSVAASAAGIVLRSRGTPAGAVEPGQQVTVPVSIRLTCGRGPAPRPDGVTTALRIRGSDGRPATRTVPLRSAASLLDVVGTVCSVRPGIRGQELSGPVASGQD